LRYFSVAIPFSGYFSFLQQWENDSWRAQNVTIPFSGLLSSLWYQSSWESKNCK